jgi:ribosomal protein L21E
MTLAAENVARHIAAGVFDEQLAEIEKAVQERLMTVRRSRTAAEFGIGDEVRFNSYCGTKYLQGHTGVVVSKSKTKLVVKLSSPVGRFSTKVGDDWQGSEVRVPPSIVDLV